VWSLGWLVALLAGGALAMAGAVHQILLVRRRARLERAREEFHRRREWLEAHFWKQAAASGRPRGLAWVECEFADEVSFARDRIQGHLHALVAVTISFEAVAGGGMEDVPAVKDQRAATAVFRYVGHQWQTEGRTVFNLNPAETIRHFRHELEVVE